MPALSIMYMIESVIFSNFENSFFFFFFACHYWTESNLINLRSFYANNTYQYNARSCSSKSIRLKMNCLFFDHCVFVDIFLFNIHWVQLLIILFFCQINKTPYKYFKKECVIMHQY